MADSEPTDPEESVREAVERSRSGAPAVGAVVRDRFSADEVFQRIVAAADEEITSGNRELFFSGLAAGFAITITFLLYVSLTAATGGHPILSAMLYPLGFIYIIIGGYQLYTENTLPPVALALDRLASLPALLRNWTVVLAGNFVGGAAGAATLAWGGVLSPEAAAAAAQIAEKGIATGWWSLFVKAIFAGLIVAGVVWVDYSARDTISRLVVVYLAFLAIPMGGLFHVVVSFTEMLYLVFQGDFALLSGMFGFVLPVLLGNTVGGVVLVTVVNYFQTTQQRLESARFEGADRQLSNREWLFGSLVGRSYVPLIDTSEVPIADETGPYRVLVPIANPPAESPLVDFALTIAAAKENAEVHAVHVVQVPDRTASGYGAGRNEAIVADSDEQLAPVRDRAQNYDVACETSTIVSHRSFGEIFQIADRKHADLVVMSRDDDRLWAAGRAEPRLSELTSHIPCDFLVLQGSAFDPSRILLPVADTPHSDLGAEVAQVLRSTAGAEITLLHVVDPDEREAGERFLTEWADGHGFGDVDLVVDDSGDIESAIAREGADKTVIMIGATEQGLLSRVVTDSLHFDVVTEVDQTILLTERSIGRSLRERLFGLR
ncbi:MAG: formate/nitrite transporter FocA (FNT family) [Halobacteriales archaeon]|jgi:formate/nitrite transporter FocA (FNT family)/nucleotide-binding universal stress UspA family protein